MKRRRQHAGGGDYGCTDTTKENKDERRFESERRLDETSGSNDTDLTRSDVLERKPKRFKGLQQYVCNNAGIHPRSRHFGYELNFYHLAEVYPHLSQYVSVSRYNTAAYKFKDPSAQVGLAAALLKLLYGINWIVGRLLHTLCLISIPIGYLCPTIPSRANYVHVIGDLLANDWRSQTESFCESEGGRSHAGRGVGCDGSGAQNVADPPRGEFISGFDIGVGANAIYSLLCSVEFGWKMKASDISMDALDIAQKNIDANLLNHLIELKHQPDPDKIFDGVIHQDERFAFCMCNPPFHESESQVGVNPVRELQARSSEVIYEHGGEQGFIQTIINESQKHAHQFIWFTSLVAKHKHLKPLQSLLATASVVDVHVLTLLQGKQTRWVLAWSYKTQATRRALFRYLTTSKSSSS